MFGWKSHEELEKGAKVEREEKGSSICLQKKLRMNEEENVSGNKQSQI